MIQNEVKDSMILAMKAKDTAAKDIYSLLLSNLKNKAIEKRVEVLDDVDSIQVIKKVVKGLTEEMEVFEKAGRTEKAETLEMQAALLKKFLPEMLSEEQVREIISGLEDKSIKSIMLRFKSDYAGRVDMGLVNRIAKEFQ